MKSKTKSKKLFLNFSRCLEFLLNRGEYHAAEVYMTQLSKRGIKYREDLKIAINSILKRLEEITNKYRFEEHEIQTVNPAFQWAQSLDHVFIEIKFAHRHDAPGCLEVKNEIVDFTSEHSLQFTAYCVQGDTPIKFFLDLDFFADVNKEASTWESSSVGRFRLTLKKNVTGMYWDRLLKSSEVPSNMKVWWEMREKFNDEIQTYMDEDDENEFNRIAEEIKKESKKKKKKKKSSIL